MDDSGTPLPNFNLYLNYLEPDAASQYEVTRNVYLITLGALFWDILSTIGQDWKLLRIGKPQPVFVAYHLSRWSTLTVVLLSVLEYTGPISRCQTIQNVVSALFFISSSASDFLFLTRVRAVYYSSKLVRFAFIFLWIADVGTIGLLFTGIRVSEIADTKHCVNNGGKEYVAAAMLVPFFFDTMVYIFITVKLLSTRNLSEKKVTWRTFSGKSLSRVSRAIMQGGQQYYLITVCCSVIMVTCWLIPSIPVVAQTSSDIPGFALTSSMACRVYRNLRLQLLDHETQTRTPEMGQGPGDGR
ncbi:hypothetical protein V8B97DRAFT_1378990 [Scleroderma yunnanense]